MVPVVNVFAQKDKVHSRRSFLAQLDQQRVGGRTTGAALRGEQLHYDGSLRPGAREKAQAENEAADQYVKNFFHDTG
jgi:hypothetical protein